MCTSLCTASKKTTLQSSYWTLLQLGLCVKTIDDKSLDTRSTKKWAECFVISTPSLLYSGTNYNLLVLKKNHHEFKENIKQIVCSKNECEHNKVHDTRV